MTITDPTLSRWERGERRRSMLLGALTAVLLMLGIVVGVGALTLNNLSDILNRRSPVIARVDAAAARDDCVNRISATFFATAGELLDAQVDPQPDPDRRATALARVQVAGKALALVASPDVDPCTVALPDLPEETP